MSNAPALRLENVTTGYGPATVLWDVTLEVAPSTIVALLGPNGAGKTTLLRAASGLLPVRQGRVYLDGDDVTRCTMTEMARKGLCHVPEGRGIFPSLSVKENLILFSPRGKEKEATAKAAASFPVLGRRLNQTAGTLSGGEQQMLAIVRSYISNPRLVLVDEASMGLAPLVVDQLFDFLTANVAQGTSLLIVEQYVHRVLDIADSVYVLSHGHMVFSGTPTELQHRDIFEQYLGAEAGLTP